jgi:hypothetical protein
VFVVWVDGRVKARYVVEFTVFCHALANVLCELHHLWSQVDEEGVT